MQGAYRCGHATEGILLWASQGERRGVHQHAGAAAAAVGWCTRKKNSAGSSPQLGTHSSLQVPGLTDEGNSPSNWVTHRTPTICSEKLHKPPGLHVDLFQLLISPGKGRPRH